MALSTSISLEVAAEQDFQLALSRTSDDEQNLSSECERRYDFRETTKEKRRCSPITSEPNGEGNGFEANSTGYTPESERQRISSNYSMEYCSPLSKFESDADSTVTDSMSTPSTDPVKRVKRKKSLINGSNQNKRRKVLSSPVQEEESGNQSKSEVYGATGKNDNYWHPHVTVAKPFNFMTDRRLKNIQVKKVDKELNFISTLRRCSQRLNQGLKPRITKPKPFSFDILTRDVQKQQVPDQKTENKASKQQPHLVIPQSPKLRAVTRHRPITFLSREQIEEKEVEEMKKWKFHAKPVDPKLFSVAGILKIESKPTTKPEGIELQTEKRFQKKAKHDKASPEKYEFHAQPVPKQMFKEPTGLKKKVQIPLTEPKSPQFTLRTRTQKSKEMEMNISVTKKVQKPPTRLRKHPPTPVEKLSTTFEKRCTEIQPFSFEEKDRIRFEKKRAKIEKALENKKMVHKFRANPMPIPGTSPTGLPAVPKKSPTKPQPFKLSVEHMAEKSAQRLKQVENELYLQVKGAAFKAKPAAVVYKPAFQPQKSTKPLTEINGFQLHTDKRATEWHEMEEVNRARSAEYEAIRESLNKEKEKKEKEELAALRQNAVHKANPIRHYKPVVIQESNKPLTQPRSPQFATSKRMHRV